MTNEYLEERMRFWRKLCPEFFKGKYNETDYDKRVYSIYQKYIKEVRLAPLADLNLEQLKELNRRCREETK